MLVPVLIAVAVVAVLVAAWLGMALSKARQQSAELAADLEAANKQLQETVAELDATKSTLASSRTRVESQEKRIGELDEQVAKLTAERDETADALRKRTELADAQAMQIDAVSAERDGVQAKLAEAEAEIAALAARPGAMVGGATDGDDSTTLWDLEVARTERMWRTSVATNPAAETTPFSETDDPVRTAVEIEAAALREDVGALITVDWNAEPIESPARRLLVLRTAQELLAQVARAPGASRLVVSEDPSTEAEAEAGADADSGAEADGKVVDVESPATTRTAGPLRMSFEPVDQGDAVINLVAPQISASLGHLSDEGVTISDDGVTVTAD